MLRRLLLLALLGICWTARSAAQPDAADSSAPLAPAALASDGKLLYVACATGQRVLIVDSATGEVVAQLRVEGTPSGLAVSPDGKTLAVTCASPASSLLLFDRANRTLTRQIQVGHTAMAPVFRPDGKTLFVCDRFDNDVAFVDAAAGTVTTRIKVSREPVAADVTPDGKWLLVANHLHAGRSDQAAVSSCLTVLDANDGKWIKQLSLPSGSGLLRDVRVSPDGRYACVTHLLSRYQVPTTQIERGWINGNALTLVDVAGLRIINTVLLDSVDHGAANPWAAAWAGDGGTIFVTHAGTHELSIIRWPCLLQKLTTVDQGSPPGETLVSASHLPSDVPNDLAFLVGCRQRLALPGQDRGPRALLILGKVAFVANYFSDSLSRVDLQSGNPQATSLRLGAQGPLSPVRRGEMLFNDATICFQGWQSCASCHSSDARIDGLNWDNLNDGIGNPKNVKSLLLAHRTPPSMAVGVRETAEQAVRAGIRHTLFTTRPEEDAWAIDEYLKSLQPIPSPHLRDGELSAAAQRGQALFASSRTGCTTCHPPPLFTNLRSYDVGTRGPFDRGDDKFDTPTLIEIWRTAPYLHDGRAASLKEIFAQWNKGDAHGETSTLSDGELDELVAYLLSL
ncbi:MAG: cell surface protein [Verrucomicrobiota bacterium]